MRRFKDPTRDYQRWCLTRGVLTHWDARGGQWFPGVGGGGETSSSAGLAPAEMKPLVRGSAQPLRLGAPSVPALLAAPPGCAARAVRARPPPPVASRGLCTPALRGSPPRRSDTASLSAALSGATHAVPG